MPGPLLSILRRLFDGYVVPRTCPVCGAVLEPAEKAMCMECLMKLPLCHERGVEIFDMRGAVVNASAPVGLVAAWYRYDPVSPYAELVRTAKYRACPSLARELGRMFAREQLRRAVAARELALADVDVLLPVPMHWSKRLRRGYNQSEEVAAGMAEVLDIPVGDNLVAVKPHKTQTRLSHSQRQSNLRGCFALTFPEELEGLNVAVVDDIITTGSSMNEAAAAISWSAPKVASISFLALGLTVKKG